MAMPMLPDNPTAGWAWFDAPESLPAEPSDDLCRSAAACLSHSGHGRMVLHHLRRVFLDRRVPPTASDAEIRHVEGQRSVVAHLLQLVERGRQRPGQYPGPTHEIRRLNPGCLIG